MIQCKYRFTRSKVIPNPDSLAIQSETTYNLIPHCHVATELAGIYCPTDDHKCQICSTHPTSPQRVNGVTCSMARKIQIDSGLEPDPKLTECVQTEQLPIAPEKLEAAHKWWNNLHYFRLDPWHCMRAKEWYLAQLDLIPSFDCNCREDWDEITLYFPIVFDRYIDFFISGWYAHNLVNTKLFKPWFPLKDAISKYKPIFKVYS